MSKWNVKTTAGELVNAQTLKSDNPPDMEANNPSFEGVVPFAKPVSAVKQPQLSGLASGEGLGLCNINRKEMLSSKRVQAGLCCFGLLVLVAILIGALFPRSPLFTVKRGDTLQSMGFTNLNNDTVTVFGNLSLEIQNPNPYGIVLADVDIIGKIGPFNNQLEWKQQIGLLNLPVGVSDQSVPFRVLVPPSVNKLTLIAAILLDCQNDNKMTSQIQGTARIVVGSISIPYSFGPTSIEARCL